VAVLSARLLERRGLVGRVDRQQHDALVAFQRADFELHRRATSS
jgi:hypothetical protein